MKLKKLGILLLAFTLCISFSQPASAEELNDNLRYGEREVVTVLKTEYVTTTVTPSGQLEGGTRFRTPGGLWVNTSGGSNCFCLSGSFMGDS